MTPYGVEGKIVREDAGIDVYMTTMPVMRVNSDRESGAKAVWDRAWSFFLL